MAVKFKDSYRVVNNYIKELDFEGLMLLGELHNLNTVLVRAELLEAYLKGEDPEEMLEDLILTAVKNAMAEAEEMAEKEMAKVTGGINIPGLF